ncbi:hypothetical protein AN2V17_11530 [Vallitalea sp. AN17-2]|uniref:Uncharacterized protein n=1 Tax=Vallitalea maricola TaxID=3074433 RepID=A0ACB5UH89_9FIRM|nr:hypothetical protein AN2V17_11530 [Vallitalea sp. AN17-2]
MLYVTNLTIISIQFYVLLLVKKLFFYTSYNFITIFLKLTYSFSYIIIILFFFGQGVTILMVQAYIIVEQALKEV